MAVRSMTGWSFTAGAGTCARSALDAERWEPLAADHDGLAWGSARAAIDAAADRWGSSRVAGLLAVRGWSGPPEARWCPSCVGGPAYRRGVVRSDARVLQTALAMIEHSVADAVWVASIRPHHAAGALIERVGPSAVRVAGESRPGVDGCLLSTHLRAPAAREFRLHEALDGAVIAAVVIAAECLRAGVPCPPGVVDPDRVAVDDGSTAVDVEFAG